MQTSIVLIVLCSSSILVRVCSQFSFEDLFAEETEDVTINCSIDQCTNSCSPLCIKKNNSVLSQASSSSPCSVQLRLENVTSKDDGPYNCVPCVTSQGCSFFKNFLLAVYRRPLPPTISSCIVRHWTWAECSWTPTMAEQFDYTSIKNKNFINQSLYYRTRFLTWQPINCNPSNEICRWSLDNSDFDYFRSPTNDTSGATDRPRSRHLCLMVEVGLLNVTLPSAFVISKIHCTDLDENVLLEPVTDVVVHTTSVSARLKWKQYSVPPRFFRGISFKTSYQSQWQNRAEWSEALSNVSEVHLTSLHPNSLHTVRIQAATEGSRLWSDTVEINFSTESSEPCQQPEVNRNGFHIQSTNETHRYVYIYWKGVSELYHCGDGFVYVVNVTSLDGLRLSYETNETSLGIVMNNWESRVDVSAKNDHGFSTLPNAWIRIPGQFDRRQKYEESFQITAVDINSTTFVRWNFTNMQNISSRTVKGLELFWCEKLHEFDKLCQDNISALLVSLSEQNTELPLEHHCDKYHIGFVVHLDSSKSEGIQWLNCSNSVADHSVTTNEGLIDEDNPMFWNSKNIAIIVIGCILFSVLASIVLIIKAFKCSINWIKKPFECQIPQHVAFVHRVNEIDEPEPARLYLCSGLTNEFAESLTESMRMLPDIADEFQARKRIDDVGVENVPPHQGLCETAQSSSELDRQISNTTEELVPIHRVLPSVWHADGPKSSSQSSEEAKAADIPITSPENSFQPDLTESDPHKECILPMISSDMELGKLEKEPDHYLGQAIKSSVSTSSSDDEYTSQIRPVIEACKINATDDDYSCVYYGKTQNLGEKSNIFDSTGYTGGCVSTNYFGQSKIPSTPAAILPQIE